jgi:L-alanine-DL-glutamate epimerase-like enolase superfamily enzyme
MKITQVDLFLLVVPLRGSFITSQSTRTHQKSVVIEVRTDTGLTGLGNVDPSPGYSEETPEEIVSCLKDILVPTVVHKDPREIVLRLADMDRQVEGHDHAKAALEMAFYDLSAKKQDVPVYRLLGGPVRDRVPLIGWVGHKSPDESAQEAAQWVSRGFRTVKVKVGKDVEEDIERVKVIRQVVGPDVQLRIDANEGYTPELAIKAIRGFSPYKILYCEQPVARDDWKGMARVRKAVNVPLMADEGIVRPQDILLVAEKKAADIVKVKVMKNGGLYKTSRMIWLAGVLGLRCVLGHGFTLGINALSEIHLAASLPSIMMPIETTGILKIEDDVISQRIKVEKGVVEVPKAVGLGATLDHDKLSQFQA